MRRFNTKEEELARQIHTLQHLIESAKIEFLEHCPHTEGQLLKLAVFSEELLARVHTLQESAK